jgi:hypothetical protein
MVLVALRNPFAESLRPGEQLRVHLMIEHVDEQRTGELLVQPSSLPYTARSERKKLCRGGGCINRGYISLFIMQKRLSETENRTAEVVL